MPWTVTRQINTYEGTRCVEISSGTLDYANPGALSKQYPGEFETFDDPREAVETAIKIAKAWQADKPKEKILIDHGSTGGYTMFFDGRPLTKRVIRELQSWANAEWESLDKCAECGDLLGEERYGSPEWCEYECCSEYCAEKYYAPVYDEETEE